MMSGTKPADQKSWADTRRQQVIYKFIYLQTETRSSLTPGRRPSPSFFLSKIFLFHFDGSSSVFYSSMFSSFFHTPTFLLFSFLFFFQNIFTIEILQSIFSYSFRRFFSPYIYQPDVDEI